jgi:membrane protein
MAFTLGGFMKVQELVALCAETLQECREDKVLRLGAALAYYSVFSLAPVLVIAMAVAGLVFGPQAVAGSVFDTLGQLLGNDGARAVRAMLDSASSPRPGLVATGLSLVMLIIGTFGVFGQMKDGLNTIWEVALRPDLNGWKFLKANLFQNVLSLALVLGIGFLLAVSLLFNALLSGLSAYWGARLPFGSFFWQTANLGVAWGLLTLLFAGLFKFVPDVEVAWPNVWGGAAFTSLLFSLGKLVIGHYLGTNSLASTYGAASSLVALLVWVFFCAQILFLGAEMTKVYARRRGVNWVAKRYAMRLSKPEGGLSRE